MVVPLHLLPIHVRELRARPEVRTVARVVVVAAPPVCVVFALMSLRLSRADLAPALACLVVQREPLFRVEVGLGFSAHASDVVAAFDAYNTQLVAARLAGRLQQTVGQPSYDVSARRSCCEAQTTYFS